MIEAQHIDRLDASIDNLKGIAAILDCYAYSGSDAGEYIYTPNLYRLLENLLFETIGEVEKVRDVVDEAFEQSKRCHNYFMTK